MIWAVQNGYVDQVAVERVKEFQTKFTEFLATRKAALLAKVEKEAFEGELASKIAGG